jgi:hypothetical protein
MLASCCDNVSVSCGDDVFPASCCDVSLMLKTLSLVLMLMMLQPSCCDVFVDDDNAPTFVL